jgi:methionyl-tRNA formyltransferase
VALAHGLPVREPATLKAAAVIDEIRSLKPDVIVVAAFARILPLDILNIPRYDCVNIHSSLLPRYRGAAPVAAAILAGDEFTGVSIMLMDQGLDTGPVLAQTQIPIADSDTTGSLTSKLSQVAASFITEILPRWVKGELKARPQNEEGASYTGVISRQSGEIDWGLPTLELWRRVRAYLPWPGAYTRWHGKRLKILEASPLAAGSGARPGQVVAPSGQVAFSIATGDGLLEVKQLQLEGRKAMPGADFLRGQSDFMGAVLPN